MKIKKPFLQKMFVAFMMMQLIVYFLNSDMYFQLSGMFLFLFGAILVGFLWVALYIWRKPINVYQVISVLMLLLVLISVLINSEVVESGYLLSYMLLIGMMFLFASLDLDESDMKLIGLAYVALAVIISLLIIVVRQRFYADEANRITIQIGSNPLIDPNYLGACLVGPSFLSLKWAMEEKKKIYYWLMTAVILVGIFMTGSRGALLAWAGGVFIVFCKLFFHHVTPKKIGLLLAGGTVGVVVAFSVIPKAYVERMLDPSNWMDASNMRRFALWKNAIEKILDRPILGFGLGNTSTIIGSAAHNSYLEICVHLGLGGGLLFLALMALVFFRKNNIYAKALLFSTAIWAVFISAEVTMYLWLNLSLCIAFQRLGMQKSRVNADSVHKDLPPL